MSRPTVLLLAPPVLYAGTWWSSKVASKPHLYSLAGFVRDPGPFAPFMQE